MTENDTQRKMLIMLMAMTPAFMMGTYIFGADVPLMVGLCAFLAAAFEWAYEKALRKENTVFDYSAMVTGAVFALTLPAGAPLWVGAAGTFIAVIVFKQLFGGFGKNKVNPAVAARVVMMFFFRKQMTTWPLNDFVKTAEDSAEIGYTPLDMLAEGRDLPGLARLLMGFISGPCGEVCAAAILIGGLFLIWKKVISPVIPLSITAAVFTFSLIYYSPAQGFQDGLYMAWFHVLAGGVLFGAFFCATDPVTSPESREAKVIYGICIGVITMAIRLWTPFPEGIPFAILIMNLLAPVTEKLAGKMRHGKNRKAAAEKQE